MSIAQIFACTFSRRLACALAVLLLCFFGVGRVHAQDTSSCASNTTNSVFCASREDAYTYSRASARHYVTAVLGREIGTETGWIQFNCVSNDCRIIYEIWASNGAQVRSERRWNSLQECPVGMGWDDSTKTCSCPGGQIKNAFSGQCQQSCSSRPEFSESQTSSTGQYIPNNSLGCSGGCMYMHFNSEDGTATGTFLGDEPHNTCLVLPTCDLPGWYLSPGTGMCQPPKPECKANQTKNPKTGECSDSCPVGMVLGDNGECEKGNDTCPAGQVRGPDGSCVQDACPAGQVKGADGTCKKETDADKDEGDDDKYFSGGDDCSAPPQCSGDSILCGQARIQWRIDCNTRRNTNISGGSCAAMPVCTGEKCDAVEYAQLVQQWRTACAVEKLADGATGEGDDEQPSWTRVDGMSQDPGAGQNADDTKGVQTKTLSTNDLDSGGWLGGAGSCPAIMGGAGGDGFGSAFAQALASPPAYFCDFIGMMAAIVMIGAAYVSAYILAKG